MPSYMALMLAELQQQRSEQARQHGELLSAIASLAQATQRLEQALAQLQAQAQAQASAPVPVPAQGVGQHSHKLGRKTRPKRHPPPKFCTGWGDWGVGQANYSEVQK